jgi:mannitol-1-phosphate/altronate dehydrogenase
MQLGHAPFTLLSCDNLQANGEAAHKALLSFGEARDAALRKWMETNITFPNSMVDRITPERPRRIAPRLRKSLAFSICSGCLGTLPAMGSRG